MRFELAEALRAKAESTDTKQSERRWLTTAARDAYRVVAAVPNEFQAAARTAAAALGPEERPDRASLTRFRGRVSGGQGGDGLGQRGEDGAALGREEQSAGDSRAAAASGARQARGPRRFSPGADRSWTMTRSIDQLNEVRYFLCWLYWEAGDYYQAAVLGDFLARRYPDHPAAAASAKLALASFERLQQAAAQAGGKPQDVEFEARKMAEIAEFMTRRWPDTPAAETRIAC